VVRRGTTACWGGTLTFTHREVFGVVAESRGILSRGKSDGTIHAGPEDLEIAQKEAISKGDRGPRMFHWS